MDIGHVHLKVSDLERSLEFWHGVMGLDVMQVIGDQAAFLSAGGYHHLIGLNTWHSKGMPQATANAPGLFHVALRYPSLAELGRALVRLDEADVPLDGAADHGVSVALYLHDPDGNGIELYWDRPVDEWPGTDAGHLDMFNARVDLDALRAGAAPPPAGAPEDPLS